VFFQGSQIAKGHVDEEGRLPSLGHDIATGSNALGLPIMR
jgi:hypothetical protein